MSLNQAQRKSAAKALNEFVREYFDGPPRMEFRDLDNLLTILAGEGLAVVPTAMTFSFPPEVELPTPAPPPALPSAQQLANRLPPTGRGPRGLTAAERELVLGWFAAALDLRDRPGFTFKASRVLEILRLLRTVSGETQNV